MASHVCPACLREFKNNNTKTKYCSQECRYSHAPTVLYEKKCPVCAVEFKAPGGIRQFCSSVCQRQNSIQNGSRRRAVLKFGYGITPEQYDETFQKQDGCCAICGRKDSGRKTSGKLSIDHSHQTGKFRGLLCHPCNVVIGLAKENLDVLKMAVEYLERNA